MPPDQQLRAFAGLVRELRAVQKASGSGYKTAAASTEATGLEKQVDAEIARLTARTQPAPKSN